MLGNSSICFDHDFFPLLLVKPMGDYWPPPRHPLRELRTTPDLVECFSHLDIYNCFCKCSFSFFFGLDLSYVTYDGLLWLLLKIY